MRRQMLALLGAVLLIATAAPASADTDAQKLVTVRQMIEAWTTWGREHNLI